MLIEFNPDGSIIGHRLPETLSFLQHFGTVELFGEATISKRQVSPNMYVLDIHDGDGHICPRCNLKKNALVEIIDQSIFGKSILLCADCYA